jgi:hypothetical protein
MVFSYYLLKIPYTLTHKLLSILRLNNYSAAYCANLLDYQMMKPVLKYLPELRIITKNRKVKTELAKAGVKSSILPAFPQNVLMCRLAAHKFPAKRIKKVGMRHGPFHFKALPDKASFLLFDKFIFTSRKEAEIAAKKGITNGIGLGYPKLDAAFNGTISDLMLTEMANKAGLDRKKKTLLFSATWQKSGMSALVKWQDRINELTSDFNVLVTLHPWTDAAVKDKIRNVKDVHLIEDYDTIPYIILADICIGDTSSILAECCALDKPIITFITPSVPRSVPMVLDMIKSFSLQINDFDELIPAINKYIAEPLLKHDERYKANNIMFSNLDGSAALKIAKLVRSKFLIKEVD